LSRPEMLTDLTFERHTRTLDFGARAPEGARHESYLAWPVLAYRVAVPEGSRDLNPLQRGVLRLLQANPTLSFAEIASLLKLHTSLVDLIAEELDEHRWLDGVTRRLTPAGTAVLRGEQPSLTSGAPIITGFIFQDPFTGEAHPRFVRELPYASLREETDWPQLIRSTRSDRRTLKLFYETGRVRPPDLLSTRALSDAYLGNLEADGVAQGSMAERTTREEAGRVRILDPLPRPLLLVTAVYFAEDDFEDDWVVANPFNTQESPYSPVLGRSLRKREGTSRALQRFLSSVYGQERNHEAGSARLFMQHARAEAERKAQVYLQDLPQHALLRKHVIQCQKALIEAEALHGEHPEKLDDVMRHVRLVAESTVLALRDLHGIAMTQDQLSRQNQQQKLLNEAAAKQLGFVDVPNTLLGVAPNKLKNANKPDADQFRGLLMACVHMATKDPAHPLARAGAKEPELLKFLDGLFAIGSKFAHPRLHPITLPEVQRAAQAAFETARILLKA
jgi:hypothetical protein